MRELLDGWIHKLKQVLDETQASSLKVKKSKILEKFSVFQIDYLDQYHEDPAGKSALRILISGEKLIIAPGYDEKNEKNAQIHRFYVKNFNGSIGYAINDYNRLAEILDSTIINHFDELEIHFINTEQSEKEAMQNVLRQNEKHGHVWKKLEVYDDYDGVLGFSKKPYSSCVDWTYKGILNDAFSIAYHFPAARRIKIDSIRLPPRAFENVIGVTDLSIQNSFETTDTVFKNNIEKAVRNSKSTLQKINITPYIRSVGFFDAIRGAPKLQSIGVFGRDALNLNTNIDIPLSVTDLAIDFDHKDMIDENWFVFKNPINIAVSNLAKPKDLYFRYLNRNKIKTLTLDGVYQDFEEVVQSIKSAEALVLLKSDTLIISQIASVLKNHDRAKSNLTSIELKQIGARSSDEMHKQWLAANAILKPTRHFVWNFRNLDNAWTFTITLVDEKTGKRAAKQPSTGLRVQATAS